ncbi:Hypothetical_protein [Hexamita inflata]|uniref:Hypothetical_protein n=1 Tax=Hexamita inflata TaxID=28002 RepID=A0AA86RUX2_9EUKA|nr:Hypothetical protein HINF_LOCUS65964 [Hexamita inflata]
MKYLQFNRETEQTSRESFGSHSPADSPIRSHPDRRPHKAHAGQRQTTTRRGTRDAWKCRELLVRSYYQFNTASYSKLRSEVWSGNSSTALGDYGEPVVPTFSFSRHLLSPPSRQRGGPGAPAVSRSGEPSRRRGPESEERRAIRPWQKARGMSWFGAASRCRTQSQPVLWRNRRRPTRYPLCSS